MSLLDPWLVDRALAQTAKYHSCASVPIPSMIAWIDWVMAAPTVRRSRFKWGEYCGVRGWAFNPERTTERTDDDGNINLCLLPAGHEGECA